MNTLRKLIAFTTALLGVQLYAESVEPFKFRINEDRGTLDWGNGEVNQDIVLALMEGLTSTGANGEAIPAAAARWELNPKTSTYTFYLRQEARWSDGKDLCAGDFVAAWKRVQDKSFASPYAHLLYPVKNVNESGCKKLIVGLEKPYTFFPELVSHWVYFPVREDLMKKVGNKFFTVENLLVNGPYELTGWKRDQKFVLEKNRHYHGKTGPARLEAFVIQDDMTALRLFEKEKLHWIRDLPFLSKKELSEKKEYILTPTHVEYYLGFSFGKGSLTREQRCAITRSIKRQAIADVLQGSEIPAYGFVPLKPYGAWVLQKIKPIAAVFEKEISINYYTKDIHQPLMEWLQGDLSAALNTTVRLIKNEGKSYWSMLTANPPAVFLSGSTAPYTHPHAFLSEFHSKSKSNWGGFRSGKYDDLVDKIVTAKKEEIPGLVKKAEEILLIDECAVVPLYFRQTAHLFSKKWRGFQMNPLARTYLNLISSAP